MDLNEIAIRCDHSIDTGHKDSIQELIENLKEMLSTENNSDQSLCTIHYFLGNLYAGFAGVEQERSADWRANNYPKNTASAINHYRQAEKLGATVKSAILHEIKTNLANQLAHQRRNIEAFELWSCDFSLQGDAPFVSSLSKARELIWISFWLNDDSHAELYKYEAYILLKSLQSHISENAHPDIFHTINNDQFIADLIKHGDNNFELFQDWQLEHDSTNYSKAENAYRSWCLENRLFTNPLNDITKSAIADQDILQFPNHTVFVGDGPFYSAAFSALKREYCFARFLAYEGMNDIHPKFENKKLFLTDTLDYVNYSGSIEKTKTAFRVCFSVLDSLAALMNAYFDCRSKNISFTSRWIKENLRGNENPFVDALYWLACDLTDTSSIPENKWKAPNPVAGEIRRMRNAIEHGWLRVAESHRSIWEKDNDFAFSITSQSLDLNTLLIIKLVRSAMLYFCMAVAYNEKQNAKPSDMQVSVKTPLVDDELISFRF